jgi:hypothetical protein
MGTVLGAALVAVALAARLGNGIGVIPVAAVAAAVVLAAHAVARFHARPTPALARRSEAAVGIAALATHVVVIATLLVAHGVRVT